MKQKIMCQKGRCFEPDTIENEFNNLFDDTNIVELIEHDLIRDLLA